MIHPRPFTAALLLAAALFAGLSLPPRASAQIPVELTREFWRDPVFVNRFLGTYGTLSGAEPRISAEEAELFKQLSEIIPNDPNRALQMLNQAINADSSAAMLFIRANLKFQQGDLNGAATDYRESIRRFPDFRRAHKNLGLIRLREGDLEAAAESLRRAVELGESDGRTFGLLGYTYFSSDKYVAAENAYRQALMLDSGNRDWTVGLAQALMSLGEYSAAGSLMEGLLADDPESTQYWLFLVNVNLNLEKTAEAAAILEILRLRGQADTNSLELLGNIYMNQEDFALALDVYDELLAGVDSLPKPEAPIRAASLFLRYGAMDEAAALMEKVESQYGEDLDREQRLQVWTLRAQWARATERSELAAELLEKILEEDPANGGAILELARYRADNGEMDKAYLLIERATRLTDTRADAFQLQGQLLVKEGKYGEAVEALESAYQLKSDDTRLRDYLAEVRRAARLSD
jgi:tetratricopeptide (TPR) repeat protein